MCTVSETEAVGEAGVREGENFLRSLPENKPWEPDWLEGFDIKSWWQHCSPVATTITERGAARRTCLLMEEYNATSEVLPKTLDLNQFKSLDPTTKFIGDTEDRETH